jgi:hypothetical protein
MTKNWFRPRYGVFGIISWMMAYVIDQNERFVIYSNDPIWNHYQSFKWWLLPHAVAGAGALFLGPMQFSAGFAIATPNCTTSWGRSMKPAC